MAVSANTTTTYDVNTIFEDLPDTFTSITPKDTPFMNAIGTRSAENKYYEWTEVDLAAPDGANRVIEGEANPGNDAGTFGKRKGNYTQISDKVIEVSETSEQVDGVGDIQKTAKQAVFKVTELKRDMETMLLANVAAAAGSETVARVTAGLPAFLTTNVDRGATGANGTTSGGSGQGYVSAAATDGTLRALTEAQLKTVIANCWTNGAKPTMLMVGALAKQRISTVFGSNVQRTMIAEKKKLTAAIEVYVSDFGTLQIVPNRFQRARDVFVLDPDHLAIAYLHKLKQKPLAETGHAKRRLIWAEYGLQVDSEKAQGMIADIDGSLA